MDRIAVRSAMALAIAGVMFAVPAAALEGRGSSSAYSPKSAVVSAPMTSEAIGGYPAVTPTSSTTSPIRDAGLALSGPALLVVDEKRKARKKASTMAGHVLTNESVLPKTSTDTMRSGELNTSQGPRTKSTNPAPSTPQPQQSAQPAKPATAPQAVAPQAGAPKPKPFQPTRTEATPTPQAPKPASPKVSAHSGVGHTTLSAQVVRKGASSHSPQIATAYAGTTYTITGVSDRWYRINIDGTQGFIAKGHFVTGTPATPAATTSSPTKKQVTNTPNAASTTKEPAPKKATAPKPAPKKAAAPKGGNLALFKSHVNAAGGHNLKVVWNYQHPQGHRVPDNAAGYWQVENTIILGPKMSTSRYQWAATHEVMHHNQRLEYGSIEKAMAALGGSLALERDADARAAAFLGYNAGAY